MAAVIQQAATPAIIHTCVPAGSEALVAEGRHYCSKHQQILTMAPAQKNHLARVPVDQ
jgi:hypothetical protein